MSEKSERKIIEEDEKKLFPAARKIAEAVCYKGNIKFENDNGETYRLITYTKDLQEIQTLLNSAISILNGAENKNLHPQVYEDVFNPMITQFNTLTSSIRLNSWQTFAKKLLKRDDDLADKDMLTEILNSLTCTLGTISTEFASTEYPKQSIKSQIPSLQERSRATETPHTKTKSPDKDKSDDEILNV